MGRQEAGSEEIEGTRSRQFLPSKCEHHSLSLGSLLTWLRYVRVLVEGLAQLLRLLDNATPEPSHPEDPPHSEV